MPSAGWARWLRRAGSAWGKLDKEAEAAIVKHTIVTHMVTRRGIMMGLAGGVSLTSTAFGAEPWSGDELMGVLR